MARRLVSAVSAVLVVAGCGGSGPGAAPTSSGSMPAYPRLASESLLDLAWVGGQQGWALAGRRCGSGTCAAVAHTTDGGQSWHPLPDPPADVSSGGGCTAEPCVSDVRFASPTIGYLYGPALLTTTDGGHSWQRRDGRQVETLAVVGTAVYRVSYTHTGCPGPCDPRLEVSRAGSARWRTLVPRVDVPDRSDTAQVVASGSSLLLAAYGSLAGPVSAQAVLYRSSDAGRSWVRAGDPCAGRRRGEQDLVALAAAPGGFFAGLCVPHGLGEGYVITSTDAGASWAPAGSVPPAPSWALLAAASPTHLSVATGPTTGGGRYTAELLASTDGGAHWTVAATDPQQVTGAVPAWLGFETSRVGRWVSAPDHVWTTENGGAHWTRSTFP